jgi:hypothetical protein
MSLPIEMQNTIDMQNAIENNRAQNIASQENKRAKLEALRMAKEIVMENYRTSPSSSSPVSADNITAVADTLISYINS